jgi:hypothetical protein
MAARGDACVSSRSMITRAAVAGVLVALTTCARSDKRVGDVTATASSPCPAQVPPAATLALPQSKNLDSVRVVVYSLENAVLGANWTERPHLLYALALAKNAVTAGFSDKAALAYVKARREDYMSLEPSGLWGYNGRDFERLLARYPRHPVSDSAAFALFSLARPGECEEDLCGFYRTWPYEAQFLGAYPQSPFANTVTASALQTFEAMDKIRDFHVPQEMGLGKHDPKWVRVWIAELDSIGRMQVPPNNTRLLTRASDLWKKWGDTTRALDALRAARMTDTVSRACLDARIGALGSRPK